MRLKVCSLILSKLYEILLNFLNLWGKKNVIEFDCNLKNKIENEGQF